MRARVAAFLQRCLTAPPPRDEIEALALALWRWQRQHNAAYAAFCGSRVPVSVETIPAVPVALFRSLPLTCFPADEARHRFHTSGTTTGHPGVHRLLDCSTYDLASEGWFHAWLPDAPRRAISLVPSPAQAPHSSLSHMVGLLHPDICWLADPDGLIDNERAWELLRAQRTPVFVASTALALASLLEGPGEAALPEGSVLMTTGGFKGRSLSVDPTALLAEASWRLGGQVTVVGEYGMTELSSQLWTRPWRIDAGDVPCSQGPYYAPPWLVTIVVDPGDGHPLPTGSVGQLRFVDLANDHSVLAIETMDQGSVGADGGVTLHGRLPGAAARGCSLTVEEALRARRRL